jgi:hypothetical protein
MVHLLVLLTLFAACGLSGGSDTSGESVTREPGIAYFQTFKGLGFPFEPRGEISQAEAEQRPTYFRGHYGVDGRLSRIEKFVQGEIEFTHDYEYYGNGRLRRVMTSGRGRPDAVYEFDEDGHRIESSQSRD